MRVLITGANGGLGRELVRQAPQKIKVLALGRHQLDICDVDATGLLFQQFEPSHIINAAAYTDVDQAQMEPAVAWEVNHTAVASLAKLADQHSARFVHISSDFVFDGAASVPYLPGARTNPISEYGKSKEAGEHAALAGCANSIVIRTASLYAADGHNFVKSVLQHLAAYDLINVVNDQVSTPTLTRSLAQCIWKFVPRSEIGLWHYTDAGSVNKSGFAQAIADEAIALGLLSTSKFIHPIAVDDSFSLAKRPRYSVLNKDATWMITGRPPEWRDQLGCYLQELKNNHAK